jgi:D-lactate dehydrogenase
MSLPAAFLRDAQQLIPADRRFDDPLSTLAFGTDASFYRLIPQLVIRVESEDEVVALLETGTKGPGPDDLSRRRHQPVWPGDQRLGFDRAWG